MKMNTSQQKHGSLMLAKGHFLAIAALLLLSACFAFFVSQESEAVTTVPTRMNFQGRLADSTGNIKANGTYNMRLRLFTAASGGTAVWTEDRLVSAGQGVTLTNGLFALQLGSVTSLPASLFASGALYLEVELPTPGTATSASPSWTEGAMTPRNQMATSAYAYNSELLDGQDGEYYLDASNLNAGTLNSARITGSYTGLTGTGALAAGSIANGFGTITTGNTIQGSRLISTVATGTAPLTVTSTTKVANLNVDLLDGLDSTAFYRESLGTVSADFNNYTGTGSYHVNAWSAGGVLNGPVGSYDWGMLDVKRFNGSTYVTQVYQPHNTDVAWTRVMWAGSWTAWREAWGSANDGAGSGLDADLLDGLSSANFIQNTTTPQSANFNITGNGTIGGSLTVTGTANINGDIDGNSKTALRTTDGWLRINPDNEFASGIYAGTGILRTDGTLQVGASGAGLNVTSGGATSIGGAVTLNVASGTAINITNAGVATDVNLQNGETIDNDVDGTVRVTASTLLATGNLTVQGTVNSSNSRSADYTSLTGASGDWFPLFNLSDSTQGAVLVNLKTYAHSSVSFTVAQGYGPSNSARINVLNAVNSTNGNYANITGIRILQDGSVEIRLSWTAGPTVGISTQITGTTGTPNPVASLATSTNPSALVDSVTSISSGLIRSGGNVELQGSLVTGGTARLTSSGVLQNVTADASVLTSGTLASARLSGSYTGITGTGALTAGSIASGFGTISTSNTIQGSRLISTVATGTAPLTVASTTLVTNLNADLLDGQQSSYFQNATNLNAGTIADARLTARLGQYAATVTDWDLATTNGWYMGYNIPNAPTASAWYIGDVVAHNNLWATQTLYAFTGDNSANTQIWRRDSSDSGGTRIWGSWYKLQVSQAEQDARYASISGSANYIQNTTTPQTANINITGSVTASGFSGSGSGLTNLSASNLSSGTINTARVSGSYTGITGTGALTAGSIGSGFGSINTGSTIATTGSLQGGSLSVGGNLVMTMPSNNPERGAYNPIWSAVGTGKSLYSDEEFASGVNSVSVYNNSGGTGVVITRETGVVGVPNSTGNQLKVSYDGIGATSPNFGGVIQPINPTANKTYVQRFRAKVPAGKTLNIHENAQGTNNTSYWLTNNVGTGKWEDYIRVSHAGNTGTFSVGGHISISGGTGAFDWYIASMNVFEVSSSSTAGGGSYIQNSTSPQTANFNITGNGTIGGSLTAGGGAIVLSGAGISGDGYSISSASDLDITASNGVNIGSQLNANAGLKIASGANEIMNATGSGGEISFGKTSAADTFTKLANPATLPAAGGYGTAFSPDSTYMSVASTSSPYLSIYKRSGDTFTKLANPATLPAGAAYNTAFSPDGKYMSVATYASPYIMIYKRSGDTFTKLADPAALPTSFGFGTAFSPDGLYMSVAHDTSPYVTIYKRSGDTFTKLANPATLPTGRGLGTTFSPDGQYMSVGHLNSPYLTIYKRSGDTFIKLADPATLPTGSVNDTNFSADGQYLSVAHTTSPYLTIYKRSGSTFTKLADPATLPTGTGNDTTFSPDGQYLSVAHTTSPYLTIYKRSDDSFTKLANPATLPVDTGYGSAFSPNGQYLSVAHSTSPYVTIYRVGSGNAVEVALNGALASTGVLQGGSLKVAGHSSLLGGASVLGSLDVQGRAAYVQTEGESPGLRVQGRQSAALFDVNIFEVVDSNGNVMLGANQGAGRRVSIIGGSGFWGTAALEVYTAEAGGRGISIKGSAGQTADYIRVIDSANNQVFAVSANGSITANLLVGKYLQGGDDAAFYDVNTANTVGIYGQQDAAQGCIRLGNTGASNICGSSSGTSIAGNVYAGTAFHSPNWFYSTGDTGWYNSTYGGGWRMIDATWIRSYGSKYVYHEVGFDSGGASGVNCGGGLGGGYTFQVCGSQHTTGVLTVSGGFNIGNANMTYGNPNALNGTYLCKRAGDNIIAMGASCTLASSIRYKENINTITSSQALDILSKLRAVGFDWKTGVTQRAANGGVADYGVIAEEIEAILPELVGKDAEGNITGVNYTGLIPFLIKAMQEQQSQITMLQGGNPTLTSLTINGPATVESLTVTGDAHVKGDVYIEGHLISKGGTPTIDAALVNCVDDLQITGTDIAGAVRFTVNDANCTSTDLRFIFAKAYGAAPNATLTAKDRVSARLLSSLDATTDKMTFSFDSLQAGKTYRFTYHVIQ